MHTVVVLAPDAVIRSDLATPLEVSERASSSDGRPPYRLQVCAPAATADQLAGDRRPPSLPKVMASGGRNGPSPRLAAASWKARVFGVAR